MGLAERRATKDFQDNDLPALKARIEAACGVSLELDVAWEKLAEDEMSHLYKDAWTKVYFAPIAEAFEAICVDQMGKDAVKASVKKVVVTNESGISNGERWASFEGGVLTLDHKPTSNIDYGQERTAGLVKVLEKGL